MQPVFQNMLVYSGLVENPGVYKKFAEGQVEAALPAQKDEPPVIIQKSEPNRGPAEWFPKPPVFQYGVNILRIHVVQIQGDLPQPGPNPMLPYDGLNQCVPGDYPFVE